jgi:hypothetical protein
VMGIKLVDGVAPEIGERDCRRAGSGDPPRAT